MLVRKVGVTACCYGLFVIPTLEACLPVGRDLYVGDNDIEIKEGKVNRSFASLWMTKKTRIGIQKVILFQKNKRCLIGNRPDRLLNLRHRNKGGAIKQIRFAISRGDR